MKLSLIMLYLFLFMICFNSQADYTITISKQIKDWEFIEAEDEMNDKKLCLLRSDTNKTVHINIYPYDGKSIYDSANVKGYVGNFEGSITYRVDKDKPVSIYSSASVDEKYTMVESFKSGTKLLLRVKPKNQFVETETDKISLVGFTKAWDLAKKCEEKEKEKEVKYYFN